MRVTCRFIADLVLAYNSEISVVWATTTSLGQISIDTVKLSALENPLFGARFSTISCILLDVLVVHEHDSFSAVDAHIFPKLV